jgi:hypothetical protein
MRRLVSSLFVVLIAGCASSGRPANIAAPEADVRLVGSAYFGSGAVAPATVEVEVLNTAAIPIVIRRVEIDSPSMVQYRVIRTARTVRESLAPGETRVVSVMVPIERTSRQLNEPLVLRAVIDFESGSDRWREIVMTR